MSFDDRRRTGMASRRELSAPAQAFTIIFCGIALSRRAHEKTRNLIALVEVARFGSRSRAGGLLW
jgi:hypothetical protein